MWEISENLPRAELTILERDEHVAEWIRLADERAKNNTDKLVQVEPVSKGGRGNKEGVRAAARELGVDKDDAHRAVKVASLSPEAKEAAQIFPRLKPLWRDLRNAAPGDGGWFQPIHQEKCRRRKCDGTRRTLFKSHRRSDRQG